MPLILLQTLTAVTRAMTPLNILLVTKGHPFEKGPFFDLFDSLSINYTHVEQPLATKVLTPELTAEYDCLVFYDMPGIDFKAGGPHYRQPSPAFKANFLKLLEAGKGMVFLHHAIAGWPAWPEYGRIIGGRFRYTSTVINGKPVSDSGYRHHVTHTVRVVDDQHPVTQGLPEQFSMTDELYLFEVFEDEIEPLLSSDFAFTPDQFYSAAAVVQRGEMNSNKDWFPPNGSDRVGWVKRYRNSPICYLQGGDDPVAWSNQHYQQLLVNAIKWASADRAHSDFAEN
ncbi:MAG: ThuA domain-containing protein [Pseudomonadales bacterium]